MGVASLSISIPESLRDYLEAEVREGGYSSLSEYVSALVRDDYDRKAEERLESLLLEGIDSGEPKEISSDYWTRKRDSLVSRR
jgi:antitoxin ParD1/3/4